MEEFNDKFDLVSKIIQLSKNNNYNQNNGDNVIFINCVKDAFQILFMNGKYTGNGFMKGVTGYNEIIENRKFRDDELIDLIDTLLKEYDIYDYIITDSIDFVLYKRNEESEINILEIEISSGLNRDEDLIKHYNQIIVNKYMKELIKTPFMSEEFNIFLEERKNKIIDKMNKEELLNVFSRLYEPELARLLKTLSVEKFKKLYELTAYDEELFVRRLLPRIKY